MSHLASSYPAKWASVGSLSLMFQSSLYLCPVSCLPHADGMWKINRVLVWSECCPFSVCFLENIPCISVDFWAAQTFESKTKWFRTINIVWQTHNLSFEACTHALLVPIQLISSHIECWMANHMLFVSADRQMRHHISFWFWGVLFAVRVVCLQFSKSISAKWLRVD